MRTLNGQDSPQVDLSPVTEEEDGILHRLFHNTNVAVQQVLQELQLRLDIRNQPANSPDLNVLDLGFFNSLQSLQLKHHTKTTEELVEIMEKVFAEYPCKKLDHVFLTLMGVMNEIIECDGGNNYALPHLNKWRLEMHGNLPRSITVTKKRSILEI